jgi:hypothetical protein
MSFEVEGDFEFENCLFVDIIGNCESGLFTVNILGFYTDKGW